MMPKAAANAIDVNVLGDMWTVYANGARMRAHYSATARRYYGELTLADDTVQRHSADSLAALHRWAVARDAEVQAQQQERQRI